MQLPVQDPQLDPPVGNPGRLAEEDEGAAGLGDHVHVQLDGHGGNGLQCKRSLGFVQHLRFK